MKMKLKPTKKIIKNEKKDGKVDDIGKTTKKIRIIDDKNRI
jgi:hypothetical protein